jgi:hypothetical protein
VRVLGAQLDAAFFAILGNLHASSKRGLDVILEALTGFWGFRQIAVLCRGKDGRQE